MIALASYLLKVIICSGVLFTYYHLVLRNKLFHQWNRFYLLAAVLLSLVAPAVELQINQPEPLPVMYAVQSANLYLDAVVERSQTTFTTDQWLMIAYAVVSLTLLSLLIISLYKLYRIIRSHTISDVNEIKFISTDVSGTPFSFFQFIFWNKEISLDTTEGQHIFQHEMVHVKEKHSYDKLLMQLVLALFWCNPFFWLIRKELQTIHEFIADKKAVGEHGAAAFAAMVLQAGYRQGYHALTNQFFQTSIKRRLKMITKMKSTRINYISRIVALPVMALVVMAFSFKSHNSAAEESSNSFIDTLPQYYFRGGKVKTIEVSPSKQNAFITMENGKKDTVPFKDVQLNLYPAPPPRPAATPGTITLKADSFSFKKSTEQPLIIVDGKEYEAALETLDPNDISAINVSKSEAAISKYGERGKSGVIEITTKAANQKNDPLFEKLEQPPSVDMQEWRRHLEKSLGSVIENAAKKGMPTGQHTVQLRFIVETDGTVSDVKALNDPGYGLAAAAVGVVSTGPRWNPGKQNGSNVRAYHTQPVTFVIADR